MLPAERVLRSERVVLPSGIRPASIGMRDGIITHIDTSDSGANGNDTNVEDVGCLVVMPGIVDSHVHINEPGRTHWEGFETGTRAAAAGGVTTIVEMPLNSIPATTTVDALNTKLVAMTGKCSVDVGLWGGLVPGNAGQLRGLHEAGVLGFKCFLVPSGVDEFEHVSEADLQIALPILAELGAVLLVHAEVPGPIDASMTTAWANDPTHRDYACYLASRPRAAENEAIALALRLARTFGARVHIVHLSSSDALESLRTARKEGVAVSVETCPHYLTFAAEDIPDGATQFKCAPPLREATNRERLWKALESGDIDLVASDHSPCPPQMKDLEGGDFASAWGGIASLQSHLSATWTGARARGLGLDSVARWLCEAPAKLAGLEGKKGINAVGYDADFVIFDDDAEATLAKDAIRYRHPISPWIGRPLVGSVRATWLRGHKIFDAERAPDPIVAGEGRWLPRNAGRTAQGAPE